jgi:beta-lactamase class A
VIAASAFINPTVTANLGKHYIINFTPLKNKLLEIEKKYPQKTYLYFLYLNNGAWIGINERSEFTAASTIKVPLAMATFKAVEEGKLNIDDKYGLNEIDLDSNFGDLFKNNPGTEYTVEELIKIMLEQSDNTAAIAIQSILMNIGIDDPYSEIYYNFGWFNGEDVLPAGEIGMPDYFNISTKALSNMLLALYNSSYLNIENSNKILTYLANSPFNEKIAAGLPKNILVAHKIGISAEVGTFSDCGIVYAPSRNYILCLGSNGGNEKIANQFMSEISAAVYDFVINN